MSHASEVSKAGDEMIRVLGTREKSGIVDYALGNRITVSWRGGDRYLCHTCVKTECEHTRRIDRYRVENFA